MDVSLRSLLRGLSFYFTHGPSLHILTYGFVKICSLYRRFQKRKPLKRGVRQFLKRSTRVSKGLLMFKDECVPTCKSASLYKSVVN